MVCTVSSSQEGAGFDFGAFLCGVCMSSLCLCGCSRGTPVSSHSPSLLNSCVYCVYAVYVGAAQGRSG